MKIYLHQLWLLLACLLLFAGLLMPIAEFSNVEGATAQLTNFRINFIEGDSCGALWALGVIQIVALAVTLFELLLSGFQNFTLQKRLLVMTMLLLTGWLILYVVYTLLVKNDAMMRPLWGASFPLISLILTCMTYFSVKRTEIAIITGANKFRLRD